MESVNLGKEESTTEDSSQSERDQEAIKKSDDKRAKLDTTEDEPQSIAVENNPDDANDKKRE